MERRQKYTVKQGAKDLAKIAIVSVAIPFAYYGYACILLSRKFTGQPQHRDRSPAVRMRSGGGCVVWAEGRRDYDDTLSKEALQLLPRRRRPLTPRMQDGSSMAPALREDQQISAQLQSVLFNRIPAEIRTMIYEYVLTGFIHIHVFRRSDNRLGNYKCYAHHRNEQIIFGNNGLLVIPSARLPKTITGASTPGMWTDDEVSEILPFLMSCRRIYSEAIEMLYRNNTFYFDGDENIRCFTETVLEQRLQLVQTVMLHWREFRRFPPDIEWMLGRRCIERMSGLRKLRIVLTRELESSRIIKLDSGPLWHTFWRLTAAEVSFENLDGDSIKI